VIVPILAGLHAVAAADAPGRIEQDAPWSTVHEASRGYQITVLLGQGLGYAIGHAASFLDSCSLTIYHFRFTQVNKFTEEKICLPARSQIDKHLSAPIDADSQKK
jgi:hypothetical protein